MMEKPGTPYTLHLHSPEKVRELCERLGIAPPPKGTELMAGMFLMSIPGFLPIATELGMVTQGWADEGSAIASDKGPATVIELKPR